MSCTGPNPAYLAWAAPNTDHLVSARLARHGVDNRVFYIRKRVARSGRVEFDHMPAFPRYVFTAPASEWELKREVLDFCGFVSFNGVPATVPDDVMVRLLREADSDGVLPIGVVDEVKFLPGMRVKVVEGPFIGYDGVFVRIVSSAWAIVMIGGRISAKIKLDQLERLESRREAAKRRTERGSSAAA
jgi:transcription antitermination factor NusG